MKIEIKKVVIIILLALLSYNCSNNDEKIILEDCEKHNFGVLTLNYSSNSVNHKVFILSKDLTISRTKTSAIGILKDTLHLKTGSYTLSISSFTKENQETQIPDMSVTTTKCSERIIDVKL
ncbi:hypothetical protein [Flavobacterium gyeonganense]|uniref:Lipoprotein n=1 Tax=Flavobacterium gyeonganense TaxID=1310418 RepID=A0ABV5H9X5_9FLAO|nr:hypothetical protein [Flavobacterium gyeonganense]